MHVAMNYSMAKPRNFDTVLAARRHLLAQLLLEVGFQFTM